MAYNTFLSWRNIPYYCLICLQYFILLISIDSLCISRWKQKGNTFSLYVCLFNSSRHYKITLYSGKPNKEPHTNRIQIQKRYENNELCRDLSKDEITEETRHSELTHLTAQCNSFACRLQKRRRRGNKQNEDVWALNITAFCTACR